MNYNSKEKTSYKKEVKKVNKILDDETIIPKKKLSKENKLAKSINSVTKKTRKVHL